MAAFRCDLKHRERCKTTQNEFKRYTAICFFGLAGAGGRTWIALDRLHGSRPRMLSLVLLPATGDRPVQEILRFVIWHDSHALNEIFLDT